MAMDMATIFAAYENAGRGTRIVSTGATLSGNVNATTQTANLANGFPFTGLLYRFTIGSKTTATITLTPVSSNADLEVLDNQGNLLQYSRATGANTDKITIPLSPADGIDGIPTDYYIRVLPNNTTVKTTFNLTYSGGLLNPKDYGGNSITEGTFTPPATLPQGADKPSEKSGLPYSPGDGSYNVTVGSNNYPIPLPTSGYRNLGNAGFLGTTVNVDSNKNTIETALTTTTLQNGFVHEFLGPFDSQDYYQFVVDPEYTSGQLEIKLSGLSQDANLELYKGASLLKSSKFSGTADEKIVLPNLEAGTYLAKVVLGPTALNTSTGYNLNVTADMPPPPDAAKDSTLGAKVLGALSTQDNVQDDYIGRQDTLDYYSFSTKSVAGGSAEAILKLKIDFPSAFTYNNYDWNKNVNFETFNQTFKVALLNATGTVIQEYNSPFTPSGTDASEKFTLDTTNGYIYLLNKTILTGNNYYVRISSADLGKDTPHYTAKFSIVPQDNAGSAGLPFAVTPEDTSIIDTNIAKENAKIAPKNFGNLGLSTLSASATDFISNYSDQHDYYKFHSDGMNKFSLNLISETRAADIEILDSTGVAIKDNYIDATTNKLVTSDKDLTKIVSGSGQFSMNSRYYLPEGDYYIHVKPASLTGATLEDFYSISLNVINPTDSAPNKDASASNLGTLVVSNVVRSDYVGRQDTIDLYKFVLSSSSDVTINLTDLDLGIDLSKAKVALYKDASEGATAKLQTPAVDSSSADGVYNYRRTSAGTYYLKISSNDANTDPNLRYKFNLAVTPSDYAGYDPANMQLNSLENPSAPNDVGYIPISTTTGASFTDFVGQADSIDYYRVKLAEYSDLQITVKPTGTAPQNVDYALYDSSIEANPDATPIINGIKTGTVTESGTAYKMVDGTYYIKVYNPASNTGLGSAYSIDIKPTSIDVEKRTVTTDSASITGGFNPQYRTDRLGGPAGYTLDTQDVYSIDVSRVNTILKLNLLEFTSTATGAVAPASEVALGAGKIEITVTDPTGKAVQADADGNFPITANMPKGKYSAVLTLSNPANGSVGYTLKASVEPLDYAPNQQANARGLSGTDYTVPTVEQLFDFSSNGTFTGVTNNSRPATLKSTRSDFVGTNVDSQDYYKFTVSEYSNVSFKLTNDTADSDLVVYEAIAGESSPLKSLTSTSLTEATSVSGLLPGKQYYVKVFPKATTGSTTNDTYYTLETTVNRSDIDSAGSATLTFGTPAGTSGPLNTDKIGGTDQSDVYAFEIKGGASDLVLRDSAGNAFDASKFTVGVFASTDTTFTTNVGLSNLAVGSYKLVLKANDTSNIFEYSFAGAIVPIDHAPTTTAEIGKNLGDRKDYVPSDLGILGLRNTDQSVKTATASAGDYVGEADTVDFYKLQVSERGEISIGIKAIDASQSVKLEIFDKDGTTVIASGTASTTGATVKANGTKSLINGQDYFLKVTPATTSYNTFYSMDVSVVSNDIDKAGDVGIPTTGGNLSWVDQTVTDYLGGTDTSDTYTFRFASNTKNDVFVKLTDGASATDVYLMDGANKVTGVLDTPTGYLKFGNLSNTNNLYYKLVFTPKDGVVNTPYTATFYASPIDQAPNTVATANNTLFTNDGTTANLAVGRVKGKAGITVGDFVGDKDTLDYYKFTVTERTNATIDLTTDTNVDLLKADGTSILRSGKSVGVDKLIYTLEDGQDYYLLVKPETGKNTYYTATMGLASNDIDASEATPKAVTGVYWADHTAIAYNGIYDTNSTNTSPSAGINERVGGTDDLFDVYKLNIASTGNPVITDKYVLSSTAVGSVKTEFYTGYANGAFTGLLNATDSVTQGTAVYAKVSSTTANGQNYTIKFNATPTDIDNATSDKPSDRTFDNANTLTQGPSNRLLVSGNYHDFVDGTVDANDIYKLLLTEQSKVTFNTPTGTTVKLVDSAGKTYDSTAVVNEGEYYVRVTGGSTGGFYDLGLKAESSDIDKAETSPVLIDNLRWTALSSAVERVGGSTDVYDLYKVTLGLNGALELTFASGATAVKAQYYKDLASANAGTAGLSFTSNKTDNFAQGTVLYVRVDSNSANAVNYQPTFKAIPSDIDNNTTASPTGASFDATRGNLLTMVHSTTATKGVNSGEYIGSDLDTNDFYKVVLEEAGDISVTLSGLDAGQNINLSLLKADGTTVVAKSENTGNADESISVTNVDNGTYYVRAYVPTGVTANTLYSTSITTAPNDIDKTETAPKALGTLGLVAPTTALVLNEFVGGSDTADLYTFTSAGNWLFDLKGVPTGVTAKINNATTLTGLEAGNYNLSLTATSIPARYDLGVFALPTETAGNTSALANSTAFDYTASTLSTTAIVKTARDFVGQSTVDSVDFYKISFAEGAVADITLSNLMVGANTEFTILKADGSTVVSSGALTGATGATQKLTLSGFGTYYVKVNSKDATSTTDNTGYNLSVSAKELDMGGQNLASATAVTPNTRIDDYIGKDTDLDYFKVTFTGQTQYMLNVSDFVGDSASSKAKVSLIRKLSDGSEKVLVAKDMSGAGMLDFGSVNAGVYYLKVAPVTGKVFYTFNGDIDAGGDKDIGAVSNIAKTLVQGESIGTVGDTEDWIKFTTSANLPSKINLTLSDSVNADADLVLYKGSKSDANPVVVDLISNGVKSLNGSSLATNSTYYAKIQSIYGATKYDVTVVA